MDENKMYDVLIDKDIATEAELNLVIDINGFNKQAMMDILYSRTGYRSFDQIPRRAM